MDLYKILGLKRDADDSAIRDAYLKKAKSTHPDQGGDAAEFKEVARAYGVLGNPLKRIAYDETGREDNGPSVEDAATMIVRNLTELVISNSNDPARTDFLKEMRGQVSQALANAAQQTSEITRKIIRCTTLAKRFSVKSGDNLIAKILQARIEQMDQQIAAIERDRANLNAALALLASYEYEVDQQAYTNYGGAYAGNLGAQSAANTWGRQ